MRAVGQNAKRHRAIKRAHLNASRLLGDARLPTPVAERVEAAIGHQWRDVQVQWLAATQQPVPDVGSVGAARHPHAFFQERVGDGECPDRNASVQFEPLDVAVATGIDGSVPIFVGRQWIPVAVVLGPINGTGDQNGPLNGRHERRHEQTVVSPRIDAGEGT